MKASIFSVIISAGLAVSAEAGNHRGQGGGGNFQAAGPAPANRNAGGVSVRSGGFASRGGYHINNNSRFNGSSQRLAALNARRNIAASNLVRSGRAETSFNQRRLNGLNSKVIARNGNRRIDGGNSGQIQNNSRHRSLGGQKELREGRVVARHPANWHKNWDKNRDHWWNGHRCRWDRHRHCWVVIWYPWYTWYPSFYAYDYYDRYPYAYDYSYDDNVYDSDAVDSYDDGGYDSSGGYDGKETVGSPVTSAQERLARLGYYNGQIDGVIGQDTYRAIMRYQSDKGLAPTGKLNVETLESLGIRY